MNNSEERIALRPSPSHHTRRCTQGSDCKPLRRQGTVPDFGTISRLRSEYFASSDSVKLNESGERRQTYVSTTKTVAEKATDYLNSTDDWVRASEVAEEVDSTTNYTREVLNGLHSSEKVEKKKEGAIIGSTINGNLWVLDTRGQAKTVIRMYGDLSEEQMEAMTLGELRTYVKGELAERSGPIETKVWFKRE